MGGLILGTLAKLKPLENRMVIDAEWRHMERTEEPQEVKEAGYYDPYTDTFVSEEKAFDYALERC